MHCRAITVSCTRILFNHIDIDPDNIHIPDGELPKEEIKKHCAAYEQKIEEAGGIDLQILGIGNNGILVLTNRVPAFIPEQG